MSIAERQSLGNRQLDLQIIEMDVPSYYCGRGSAINHIIT